MVNLKKLDITGCVELFHEELGRRNDILKRFANSSASDFSLLVTKLQRNYSVVNSIFEYVKMGFSSAKLDDWNFSNFKWSLILISRLAHFDFFKTIIYQENLIQKMPEIWLAREYDMGHRLCGIRLLYNMLRLEPEASDSSHLLLAWITHQFIYYDIAYKVIYYGLSGNESERFYCVKVIELLLTSDRFWQEMIANEYLCERIFQLLEPTMVNLKKLDITGCVELFHEQRGRLNDILKRFAQSSGSDFALLVTNLKRNYSVVNSIFEYVKMGFSSAKLDDWNLCNFKWSLILISRLAHFNFFKIIIYKENLIQKMPEIWLAREYDMGHRLCGIRLLYNMLRFQIEPEACDFSHLLLPWIVQDFIHHDIIYKVIVYGLSGNESERFYCVKVIELLLTTDRFLEELIVNEHLCARVFQFLGVSLLYLRYTTDCRDMFLPTLRCYLNLLHVERLWPQYAIRLPPCIVDKSILQHYEQSGDEEAAIYIEAIYSQINNYARYESD